MINTVKASKIVIILLCIGFVFSSDQTAQAVTASEWKAGNIIDDVIFTDKGSLSVDQIQTFLNSKVGTGTNGVPGQCDTNGTRTSEWGGGTRAQYGASVGKPGPFTCLKDFYEVPKTEPGPGIPENNYGGKPTPAGARSAAQLIWDAAQRYNISPKVLLVKLGTESAGPLTSDDWPFLSQYTYAMGAHCPDVWDPVQQKWVAKCDVNYSGFSIQISESAKMLRGYLDNMTQPWWPYRKPYQTNKLLYNMDENACGSSNVYIENKATAALYTYTPYQPNAAALNNMYGTGDSCSAYGNRNFWRTFSDWFGSTSGLLVKVRDGDGTIYLNFGGTYYPIPSWDIIRAYGLGGTPLTLIDRSALQDLSQGPLLSQVVRFGDNATVYLVEGGSYHPVQDWTTLARYGFDSNNKVDYTNTNLLNILRSGDTMSVFARQPNGAIYYVDSMKKHIFLDYKTFSNVGPSLSSNGQLNFSNLSNEFMNRLNDSSPMLIDGSFVKAYGQATVYLYDKGLLRPLSYNNWMSWGARLDYDNINPVSLSQITNGTIAPTIITDGTARYLVSSGKKYIFDANTQSSWGLADNQFNLVSSQALDRLTAGDHVKLLIRLFDGSVYKVSDGSRTAIPSLNDFNGFGYLWADVLNVDISVQSVLPNSGMLAFSPGSLIRLPDGSVSWVDNNNTRWTFPSADSFNNFGLNWGDIRNFDLHSLDNYITQSLQQLIQAPDGAIYLAEKGHLLTVDPQAYGATQYSFSGWVKSRLSSSLISKVPIGPHLSQFIQGSSATIYKVIDGKKCAARSPGSFIAAGGDWNTITKVSDGFLAKLQNGDTF